jgi:hypothetical protein
MPRDRAASFAGCGEENEELCERSRVYGRAEAEDRMNGNNARNGSGTGEGGGRVEGGGDVSAPDRRGGCGRRRNCSRWRAADGCNNISQWSEEKGRGCGFRCDANDAVGR